MTRNKRAGFLIVSNVAIKSVTAERTKSSVARNARPGISII